MAEKRVGDSSDSDVYMSADEGLGSSRGSENRHKVDRYVHFLPLFPSRDSSREQRSPLRILGIRGIV